MKKYLLILLLLLVQSSLNELLGQSSSFIVNTGGKNESFSAFANSDTTFIIYSGPGYFVMDGNANVLQCQHYLSSGYSGGKMYQAANGDLLMMINSLTIGSGGGDVMLFRMLPDGSIRWIRVYGTAQHEEAKALLELPNGNILIAMTAEGFAGSDAVMVMAAIDSTGSQLWQHSYSTDAGPAEASALIRTKDGSLWFTGNAPQGGIILNIDIQGVLQDSYALDSCNILDVIQDTTSENLYFCGDRMFQSDTSAFIAAFSSALTPLWQKSLINQLAPFNYRNSSLRFIRFMPDSNLILAGGSINDASAIPENSGLDALAVIMDATGQNSKVGVMTDMQDQHFNDVIIGNSGKLIWLGYNNFWSPPSAAYVQLTDFQLSSDCGLTPDFVFDTSMMLLTDPAFIMDTGNLDVITYCFPPAPATWSIEAFCGVGFEETKPFEQNQFLVFPIPATSSIEIYCPEYCERCYHLTIVNAMGDEAFVQSAYSDYSGRIFINGLEQLAPGVYVIQVRFNERTFVSRLLILK